MDKIKEYLRSKGKTNLVNELIVISSRMDSLEKEVDTQKEFIDSMVSILKKKVHREKILFDLVEEARKKGYL